MDPRTAVLLTCHNRVERTLRCLASLFEQDDTRVALEAVLVDAGSSDGTADAVEAAFPQVTVLRRGPDLFWNGGMRVAFAHAYPTDPDLYLWLNDDVVLDGDALEVLITTHDSLLAEGGPPSIVVGSTRDPTTGGPTYGGVVRPNARRPLHYELVPPGEGAVEAETMNGNVVLVPRDVVARIGTLAAAYTHGMGDYDYGHRARRAGCEVWVAPGTLATCARNPAPREASSLAEHQQRATGVTTGLPPDEWFTFARRWAGPLWPLFAISPYVRRFLRWLRRNRTAGLEPARSHAATSDRKIGPVAGAIGEGGAPQGLQRRLRAVWGRALSTLLCWSLLALGAESNLRGEGFGDRVYYVDPALITLKLAPFSHTVVNTAFTQRLAVPGTWDRFCIPYLWHPAVRQRLEGPGFPGPDRRPHRSLRPVRAFDRRRRTRYRSPEAVDRRITSIDATLSSIAEHGYRAQTKVPGRQDEIGVCITRRGELVWARQGDHRLTLAQILRVPEVPVILRGVHLSWARDAKRRVPPLPIADAIERSLHEIGLRRLADHQLAGPRAAGGAGSASRARPHPPSGRT